MKDPFPVVLVIALALLGAWWFWPFWPESPAVQAPLAVLGEQPEPGAKATRHAFRSDVDPSIEAGFPAADAGPQVLEAAPRPSPSLPSGLIVALRNVFDEPLAGVEVTLRPGERDQRRGISGIDGEVWFEDLAAGRYGYRVAAPGQPELRAAAAVQLVAGETRRVVVRLDERDETIAGRVIDRDGQPVGGLTVKARHYRPPADATFLVPAGQEATSAEDGSFEIAGLADGAYEVRTLADDRYPSVAEMVRAGIDDVLLNVAERQEVRIFGQVTDRYGEVLSGASVVPFGASSRRTRTDEEGRYELLVQAGEDVARQRIAFLADGHQPEHVDVGAAELHRLADLRVDAVLDAVGETVTVAGQVVDERGQSVAGERVYLRAADFKTHYQVVSGRDGSFVVRQVAASAGYELRVLPQGDYQDYVRDPVDLSIDTADLEIVLEGLALGTLTGQMVDTSGAPVLGFDLRLVSEGARTRSREVRGNAWGSFEVIDVPAGALTLTSSAPEMRIDGVRVDAGADTDVDLVLDWGDAVLNGRVIDPDGDPVAGAEVDLYWRHERAGVRSSAKRTAVTDGAGSFAFARLGAGGTRQLQVRAGDQGGFQQMLEPGQSWLEVRLPSREEIERRAREAVHKGD